MLDNLFGNKSAEKVMLSLFEGEELHASAIAKSYQTAIDPIKKQLEKFEEAGFLLSRKVGRSKLYRFNKSHPVFPPLYEILRIANLKKLSSKKGNRNEIN